MSPVSMKIVEGMLMQNLKESRLEMNSVGPLIFLRLGKMSLPIANLIWLFINDFIINENNIRVTYPQEQDIVVN